MRLRIVAVVLPALVAGLSLCLVGPLQAGGKDKVPVFKLAWSEYPSWSVFGVASDLGLIDGREGKQGALEKRWGVDIVLNLLDYDPCIQAYASKTVDAVCITNIDVLPPAMGGRKSVAIMPTSTSVGADALLVLSSRIPVLDRKDWKNKEKMKAALEKLKKEKVYGLAKSVSEYAFNRNLELLGEDPKDYKFTDEPPDTAAKAMAAKQKDHPAIMVWNPFVLTVERKNEDARRFFDSSTIPEEIIDMVVMGQDSLDKPKGKEAACCIIECFYEFNKRLADKKERDGLLKKLGEKFSNLGVKDMERCVTETRFYATPEAGLAFFQGDKLKDTMKKVGKFCKDKEMIKTDANYGFGTKDTAKDALLRFDPSYIRAVRQTD